GRGKGLNDGNRVRFSGRWGDSVRGAGDREGERKLRSPVCGRPPPTAISAAREPRIGLRRPSSLAHRLPNNMRLVRRADLLFGLILAALVGVVAAVLATQLGGS